MKTFEFKAKDQKTNKIKTVGKMEIKNLTAEKAQLYFYGDIVNDSWDSYWYDEDKCPQDILDFLSQLDGTSELEIYVNSGGGSVHGGLAIYHQLKRYAGKKTAYVDGIAGSIASIIPFACDTRIIYDSAQLMIHKPWCGVYGNATDLRKQADALDSCQEAIVNIYMENVKDGVTREQIEEMVDAETWLTGTRAQEFFNVEVQEEATSIPSYSNFYNMYRHKPKNIEEIKETEETEESKEIENKIEDSKEKEKLLVELELMTM